MKFIKLYSALFLVFATLVLGAGNADAKGDDFEMTNLDVGAEILYQDIQKYWQRLSSHTEDMPHDEH